MAIRTLLIASILLFVILFASQNVLAAESTHAPLTGVEAATENATLTLGNQFYLPIVFSGGPDVGSAPAKVDTNVFNVIQDPGVTRLLSLAELHGQPCGSESVLEVHVFGHAGESQRLDGVIVQVLHTDWDGARFEELRATGGAADSRGVVRFNLRRDAVVQVFTDDNGRKVESAAMAVTSTPAQLSPGQLMGGGFCSDSANCQAFASGHNCQGGLSWNVAFKRSY